METVLLSSLLEELLLLGAETLPLPGTLPLLEGTTTLLLVCLLFSPSLAERHTLTLDMCDSIG